MPSSVRSYGSKRSSSKRRRGPSSVKSDDTHSSSRVHKLIKEDIHLKGKVLGYISELPTRRHPNGNIIVRRIEDFQPPQIKDLGAVQSYLQNTRRWPASSDQEKAVSKQFANIVDKKRDYRALGLKWNWPGRVSKVPGEIKMLDSSEPDDLVLVDIEVRDGVGYAVNVENISANIRLAIPEDKTQETRKLASKLDDALEERLHLKAQLNKARAELHLTPEDCMDESKPRSDYRNGYRRCEEICESRVKKAPARIARVEAQIEDNWQTIISLERILRGDRGLQDPYAQDERGRPRQRSDRVPSIPAYGRGHDLRTPSFGGGQYAPPRYQTEIRRPSFSSRSSSMFPGADRRAETPASLRGRSTTPIGARGFSRMPSYSEWHDSKSYLDDRMNDEGYFSMPNSRAASLSRSRSGSASMRPGPRMRRSSFWSTDTFPPLRPFRPSRSSSFSSRSFSLPRQPSVYGGAYGGPPSFSGMPSRSGSRGGGYRRQYVSDTGSVVNEESYNEGGWNVRISNRSNSIGGGRNRSSMSHRTGVHSH